MSFEKRAITVTLQVGKGAYGESGYDSYTYSGLKVRLQSEFVSLPAQSWGIIGVYGMPFNDMIMLSRTGLEATNARYNQIIVEAGETGKMTTVFSGVYLFGAPQFTQPESPFVVEAFMGGGVLALKPVSPVSFSGSVDGVTVLKAILSGSGYAYEGPSSLGPLTRPYHAGTRQQMINEVLAALKCNGHIDDRDHVLSVWPKGSVRTGSAPPVISPANGMIGYPSFDRIFMDVRTVFDISLASLGLAQPFTVQGSQFPPANGTWYTRRMGLDLLSQTPGGPWEMQIHGMPEKNA